LNRLVDLNEILCVVDDVEYYIDYIFFNSVVSTSKKADV
jgi:hypothetical protein